MLQDSVLFGVTPDFAWAPAFVSLLSMPKLCLYPSCLQPCISRLRRRKVGNCSVGAFHVVIEACRSVAPLPALFSQAGGNHLGPADGKTKTRIISVRLSPGAAAVGCPVAFCVEVGRRSDSRNKSRRRHIRWRKKKRFLFQSGSVGFWPQAIFLFQTDWSYLLNAYTTVMLFVALFAVGCICVCSRRLRSFIVVPNDKWPGAVQ